MISFFLKVTGVLYPILGALDPCFGFFMVSPVGVKARIGSLIPTLEERYIRPTCFQKAELYDSINQFKKTQLAYPQRYSTNHGKFSPVLLLLTY